MSRARVARGKRGRVTFNAPEDDFGFLVALFVARVGGIAVLLSIILGCTL